jgi:hypothetical protein
MPVAAGILVASFLAMSIRSRSRAYRRHRTYVSDRCCALLAGGGAPEDSREVDLSPLTGLTPQRALTEYAADGIEPSMSELPDTMSVPHSNRARLGRAPGLFW